MSPSSICSMCLTEEVSVFPSHSLYMHMSCRDNMWWGLSPLAIVNQTLESLLIEAVPQF